MRKTILLLGICPVLIANFCTAQVDYAQKVQIFEAHIDKRNNFSLSYEEFADMKDTLENLSLSMIQILKRLEDERDSIEIDSITKELFTFRKALFNLVSSKVFGISFDEVENWSRNHSTLSDSQFKLGILFRLYFPLEGKGYSVIPVDDNPELTLFF